MIKHIVLWKLKNSNDKQENMESIIRMLTALVGKVDGLTSVELGKSFALSGDYDLMLCSCHTDSMALTMYQNHPEHVKCKGFIGSVTEKRLAFDYYYDVRNTAALTDEQAAAMKANSNPISVTTVAAVPLSDTKVPSEKKADFFSRQTADGNETAGAADAIKDAVGEDKKPASEPITAPPVFTPAAPAKPAVHQVHRKLLPTTHRSIRFPPRMQLS